MEIIKLINEIISELNLNEIEYKDNEKIDFKKIDLYSEYHKYNSLLFNNEAPEIPIVLSNRKGALGHVKFLRSKTTSEIKLIHLAITTFYDLNYSTFKNTFVHEMIHTYLLGKGIMDNWGSRYSLDPHGRHFHQLADKFNAMGMGFNITKDNIENLELSQKTILNTKEMLAIFINTDGNPNAVITSPSIYKTAGEVEALTRLFQNIINRGKYRKVDITFVLTKNPELIRIAPTVRKLSGGGIRYAPTTTEFQKEVVDNGNVLKTINLSRTLTEDDIGNDWEEFIIS